MNNAIETASADAGDGMRDTAVVEVIVRGDANTGKSTIMAAVCRILGEAGIEYEVQGFPDSVDSVQRRLDNDHKQLLGRLQGKVKVLVFESNNNTCSVR